jgi:NADH dehydrogenase
MNHKRTIAILGGTGFVGRHLVARLAAQGHELRVLTRNPYRHRDLTVLPTLRLIQADVFAPMELRQHLAGCDTAINLVGILNERPGRPGQTFREVHAELPRKLMDVCHDLGVARLLHMSALNADAARGPSLYLRTKGEGENYVLTHSGKRVQATSFRPSVIFGPGDSFMNRFARLLRWSPGVFPLACPKARFQPVYVGDVVEFIIEALDDPETFGSRFDLCGPREYTLREIVRYCARVLGVHRWILGLPDWASRLQARILQHVPGRPFTMDNYLSMTVLSVCARGIRMTTSMESVVPQYLTGHGGREAQLQKLRETRWGAAA